MQPPAAAGPSSAGPPSRPQRPAPADPFASAEQAPGSAPVEEPEEDEDSVWMEFDLDDASAGDTFDDEILNITEDNLESDGILSRLPPIPLLDTLAPEEFGELIQRAEVQMFMDGDTLFEEGDAGNSLFVLVEGMAAVTTAGPPPTDLGTLREGEVFGEVGLLTETERAATITAITDGMALEISRDAMAEVVTRHPDVLRKLLRFFRMRVLDVLIQTHELFAPYAEEDRSELERRFVFVDAGPSATLATQGQPSEALLILLAGRAAVTRDGRAIGELHAGDLLGEPSLLTGQPSVITAVTVTKCWLLKLDRATFNKLLFEHPKSLDLVTELSQRFEKQLDALETGARLELFSVTML